ncbi:type VII secretion protein EccE [Kineosporia mesophila]|uniref:type VII secretion protein EccE n=1 Tax=Kineosporia mesophila TaxID=566012 RepID=UPI001E3AB245|nr:type VII secretion protein EccE [Kineosporia mesophila]MCD5348530.1 hypothetical protein [Kineosporia mesophila]
MVSSAVPSEQPQDAVLEGLPLHNRPHRVGRLHLAQLLVLEVVLIGVAAAYGLGPMPMAGVAVAGLAVVLLTFRRQQRRWAAEWQMLSWGLKRRIRGRSPKHPDPRVTALRAVAPGLDVAPGETADGLPVGIAGDRAGWFVVLECVGSSEHLADTVPGPPLDRMAQLVAESDIPGVRVQVVTRTVPSSVGAARAQALGAPEFGPTARQVTTWVAVRLDATALAEQARSAEVSPPDVLLTLVRRIESLLKRTTRVSWRVLDTEGVVEALTRSCGVDGAIEPVEDWERLRTGRLNHVTFWVRSWPAEGEPRLLLDALALVPAAFTNVSILLEPGPKTTRMRCLVRISAEITEFESVVDTVYQVSDQLQAELQRLDAEQGPAAYASAPSGGGIG